LLRIFEKGDILVLGSIIKAYSVELRMENLLGMSISDYIGKLLWAPEERIPYVYFLVNYESDSGKKEGWKFIFLRIKPLWTQQIQELSRKGGSFFFFDWLLVLFLNFIENGFRYCNDFQHGKTYRWNNEEFPIIMVAPKHRYSRYSHIQYLPEIQQVDNAKALHFCFGIIYFFWVKFQFLLIMLIRRSCFLIIFDYLFS